jgi:haloalkane dehalogenase
MRVEFTPSPALFPFQSRWSQIDGIRVHYLDEGAGRPILMCHGNPTWSFLYRKLIERLQGQFRCVAMDYPGFGLSDRPEGYGYTPAEHAAIVGRLVDQLGLDGFMVMGQDWGGPIGMSVASRRAERVAGLVFMNTWFWRTDRLAMQLFSRVMSSRPLQRRILERNFFVERLMPRSVTHPLEVEVLEHYRRAQPTPEARWGVAEFPRQILASGAWLERLASQAPRALGDKPPGSCGATTCRWQGTRASRHGCGSNRSPGSSTSWSPSASCTGSIGSPHRPVCGTTCSGATQSC